LKPGEEIRERKIWKLIGDQILTQNKRHLSVFLINTNLQPVN
jgi:hypothetical protein